MNPMGQRKVLLIDDSEVALHFASRVLGRAGFEVRTTADVQDLHSVLGGWRPDVILARPMAFCRRRTDSSGCPLS